MDPAGEPALPPRTRAADLFSWVAMIGGGLLAGWSVSNFAGRPGPNALDYVDLLLGAVVAVTLLACGVRLRQGRSPWRLLLVGLVVSAALVVLAVWVTIRSCGAGGCP